MGNVFGRLLRVTTFGESHGAGLGAVVEGAPAGLALTEEMVQRQLDRRKPGGSAYVSARREPDRVEIVSGVHNGLTIGAPVAMLIRNTNARGKDYGDLAALFRPGHADFTWHAKHGLSPLPGGGRSSGRETAGRVAAGAVARAILEPLGVRLTAYTVQVGQARATRVDQAFAEGHPLRAADPEAAPAMEAEVDAARAAGDSVGGVVEVVAAGAPAGLGEPVFGKLDAALGGAMLSIGGVKGVEVGAGFAAAGRRGSANNDQMGPDGFLSNNAGGTLGGISTGQDLVLRLAVKPTPSISQEQQTRTLDGRAATISVKGRHDPCLCPRIAPVAEAMAALVLADAWLIHRGISGG